MCVCVKHFLFYILGDKLEDLVRSASKVLFIMDNSCFFKLY